MLHQVGVGTLGPVFRTYEPTRDRLVAVKVFRLDITPEQAQSLADELVRPTEAGLFHPSIVEPIAAGVEGTSAYRADEYVAAETLDVALRHYAPAPVEKVLPFITQLAGAIDFARSAGIGHGALHPRDVFVTPEEARASGFGVVEGLERVGLRAPVRRPYTAPERIAGGVWGLPADVFSLAVIAYELLTGRRPSGTGAQIAPVTGGPHASAVHAVIVKAMSDDPARRYPSALAFASALDAASRDARVQAPVSTAVAAEPEENADATVADIPRAIISAPPSRTEAESAEAEFRTSELDFDEIPAERDHRDEAALTPVRGEVPEDLTTSAASLDRASYHDEPVEDLAIERDVTGNIDAFADEFASEPGAIDQEVAVPARPAAPRHAPARVLAVPEEDEEPAAPYAGAPLSGYGGDAAVREQRGFGFVPVAVTVLLALLVGFAAGYAVRGGAATTTSETTTASGTGSEAATSTQQPATPPTPAPKPFSEQTVAPKPSEPPPAVAEVPTAGAPAPAPRTDAPAATRPTPPRGPTAGTVDVRSTPTGAGVTVDGRWRGRTPLTLADLKFGTYTIRVVQPGFVPAREQVSLSSSIPTRALSFRLQRNAPPPAARPTTREAETRKPGAAESYTGSIYVDSRPRGARVLVDGKLMGTTPVRIPEIAVGSHVVRLQLEDHSDWTTSTRVTSSQEARVTGSLERIR